MYPRNSGNLTVKKEHGSFGKSQRKSKRTHYNSCDLKVIDEAKLQVHNLDYKKPAENVTVRPTAFKGVFMKDAS